MDFSEYIPNTQMLHAITAHLPVALSIVGVMVILVGVFVRSQRDALRWMAVACYVLLAATAYVAVQTGEDARAELSGELPKSVWDIVNDHQSMADRVWMFAGGTAALIVVSAFTRGPGRTAFSMIGIGAGVVTAVWVGLAGHHGGELVYDHGIGIPPEHVMEWRLHPPSAEALAARKAEKKQEKEIYLIPITPIDPVEAEQVSYIRDIVPIFEEACIECHEPGKIDSDLLMTSVEELLKGGEKYGPSIIPGKPDESTTIQYVRGELQPQMPQDDMPLTREMVHTLRLWISAGAIDDSNTLVP